MAAKTAVDTNRDEYTTYVPSGHRCVRCEQPITLSEPCRRATLGAGSGSQTVTYRHLDCEDLNGTERGASR
ncbi:hypothetical protein ABT154_30180 [Streptomyces sp. NPDC001728]|uniref:hypothetical protein n=1 Tax=Streptomyces sp. NPDC001728 TaxID=3154396 RepID=UPI00332E419F